MTKTLSLPNLIDKLNARKGAQIISFKARTIQKLTRVKGTKFHKKEVIKIARVNGIVNWNYANAVNNQRAREDHPEMFIPEPRKWGTRIKKTPFVIHDGSNGASVFVEVKVQRSLEHQYLFEDEPIDEGEIIPYLPVRVEGARQELEKPVILRDYRITSLKEIKVAGEDCEIDIDPAEELKLYQILENM